MDTRSGEIDTPQATRRKGEAQVAEADGAERLTPPKSKKAEAVVKGEKKAMKPITILKTREGKVKQTDPK